MILKLYPKSDNGPISDLVTIGKSVKFKDGKIAGKITKADHTSVTIKFTIIGYIKFRYLNKVLT